VQVLSIFIFVVTNGSGTRALLKTYFRFQVEIWKATLEARGKTEALEELRRDLPPAGLFQFYAQPIPSRPGARCRVRTKTSCWKMNHSLLLVALDMGHEVGEHLWPGQSCAA